MRRPSPASPAALALGSLLAIGCASVLAGCGAETEPTRQTLPPAASSTVPATGGTGSTTPGSGSGTTVKPGPSKAFVTSFDLRNDLSCYGEQVVTTSASYATTGASTVAFLVDGTQISGTPPVKGTFDIPISCDDRSHTVVLVAVDPDGRTTVESRVVLTSSTPKGN